MEVQGGIDPQFGGQMQPTLSAHLQGVVVAKMTIHHDML